ncbi:MAG: PAS domain-containing sensor histidine kinase [Bacteroidales bacterium]|nr:PAS domain-containing sensor histidine kinase [Bacteroidales bacterium]
MDQKYINKNKQPEEEDKKLSEYADDIYDQLNPDQYLSIYNKIPVGVILFNKDLIVTDANNTFLKIFEITRNQICNFKINKITDKRILPAFEQVLKGYEGFYEGEYKSTFKNLELFISIHSKPFVYTFDNQIIDGGIAVFQDVTEHTIAERAVNRSYDTFQKVTDNVNAIIYVIDPETFKVLFMNSKAVNVFGEKVGEICHIAFFGTDEKCETCQINTLKKNNIEIGKFLETDFFEKSSGKWFQLSYGFIEWINEKKVMLLTSIDITDVKNAQVKIQEQNIKFEETLKKLTEQNEKINKQSNELKVSGAIKDTMFSIIAHDLRGPVGNITSALDIIIDDIEEFDKKEIIEIIKPVRDSAGSAYNLLVNLLFWAKNESGETFFIREEILINDIIEDVLTLFKPNFESKNIKLINKLNNEYYVFADEHMIHTVIRNLISNAVKYTKVNGIVELSIDKVLKENKEYIKFTVKDTGVGISQENILKMLNTKEFYSTYGTNKEKGTGIGMILTKEFVERHNGFISIKSEIDKGTDISVFLPSEPS